MGPKLYRRVFLMGSLATHRVSCKYSDQTAQLQSCRKCCDQLHIMSLSQISIVAVPYFDYCG